MMQDMSKNIAAPWASAFLRFLLDAWQEASQTNNGIFYPHLDRNWQKMPCRSATLVSQSRLIYNFSRGYETFQKHSYAASVEQGIEALQRCFLSPTGHYYWAVALDGSAVDTAADCYGHAFCLLALSTAAAVFARSDWAALASAVWKSTLKEFAEPNGGFQWRREGGAGRQAAQRSQNPLMHLFEALMAFCAVDSSGDALGGAERLLRFLCSLPGFEQGRLIELYTADWTPLPIEQGGVLNLGHQFEWAFLLSEWNRLTAKPERILTEKAFLETAMQWGLSPQGAVYESCAPDGALINRQNGLWQQCEAVRALRRALRSPSPPPESVYAFQMALRFYQENFVDPDRGGVYAALAGEDFPADPHKGDVWKLDYHSVNMCLELIY
jgi:mannose/cellobiose epimerase-like protein (N-acyl-D-glucosamine 2-epimerase family)